MQKISFKQWNWWISNDEILWLKWSHKMMEWVDILNNSQYVKLAKWYNYVELQNTRYVWDIMWSLYGTFTKYLEISRDWYITNFFNKWNYFVLDLEYSLWNIWLFTKWWLKYWFIISNNWAHIWDYKDSSNTLWVINDSNNWINTDRAFNNDWNWTIWAWWEVNWQWVHTPWNTDSLSRTIWTVNWTTYRFEISWYASAWSVEIKTWWVSHWFFNAWDQKIILEFTAQADNEKLEFDPSDDFDWYIDNNFIQEKLIKLHTHSFNYENAPYVIYWNYIYVWNDSKITRIDLTIPSNPIFTDYEIINWAYKVKWLTRIWDQFFIYASNGSNSKQYLWDWENQEAQRVITWVDKPIQNVANFGNLDYVITGTEHRQTLSVVNWYNLEPLINTKEYINNWDRIYFNVSYTNSIETIVNKLLLAGNDWIYSYWNVIPWFNKCLNKEYIWINWTITNMFFDTSLWYNLYVYFKWNYNWTYWNYKVKYYLPEWDDNEQYIIDRYWTTGWIELKPYLWNEYSNIKTLNKYVVWYNLEPDTYLLSYIKDKNYVNIYHTTDDTFSVWDVYSCNWVNYTIKSVNWHILNCETSEEITRPVADEFTKVSWNWPDTFNNVKMRLWYKLLNKIDKWNKYTWYITKKVEIIDFAVELITTNEKYSPKLYNFDIYFDEINQDD